MSGYLGIHAGREGVTLAVVDARAGLVASAGPAPLRGRPLGALGELLEGAGEDVRAAARSADRALAAGTGAALIAEAVSAGEVSVVAAAADAAAGLVPGAGSVLLMGAEDAFLALLDGAEARDVRSSGACGFGAGWLLSRWAPGGADPAAAASLGESIPAGCARVADEALARLRLEGAAPEVIAAQALGGAARLLASDLVRGGPVDPPVALVGGPATTPGLSRALEEALGLSGGSVTAPELAGLAVAIGAARLARALGRPPDLPAEWPAARDEAASPPPPPHAEAGTLQSCGPLAALGIDIGLSEVRVARCDSAGRFANSERVPLGGAGALGAAGEFLGPPPAAVTGNLADRVARDFGARSVTRAGALARFAASRGAKWALDIGASESCLVRLDTDGRLAEASYPAPCGRGLGRALEDVADALGLPDVRALGTLAEDAPRGAWLRDRCAGTIRKDAGVLLASGVPPTEVARGAVDAVARSSRRRLAGSSPPAPPPAAGAGGPLLLTGRAARVPGLAEAITRAFGCEVSVAPGGDFACAIGAALSGRAVAEAAPAGAAPAAVEEVEESEGVADGIAERERILREHVPLRAAGRRIARIGLPMSLLGAERGPFWARFLSDLYFDVLIARTPDRWAFLRAAMGSAGTPCGAAELMRAEVASLAESGADAIFIPVEVDAQARAGAREIVYRCPFRQAGAYLAPAGTVPVVSPIRFGAFPERLGFDALVRSLSRWKIDRRAVREALSSAREAEERFERAVRSRGEAMIESLGEGGRAVVVLGRAYSARVLPNQARRALGAGGVAIVPQDFLQPAEDDLRAAAREMHWDCGRKILAAARTVARDGRLGAVYLTHARCGPDSFILKYAREILDGWPWTSLELPPGGGDTAPLVERCRAFRAAWDAQYELGRSPEPREIPEHAEPPRRKDVKTLIHFPDMGIAADTGVAALSAFDIEGEVVRADEESLRAAAGHTSGDECLPYIVTIGNLVKTARADGFDPARAAFFMATSSGSCRFGQYRRGFRLCLDALGHDDIRVISLNQSEEKTKQMPGLAFGLLLWKGLTALGAVERVALHVRPRASDPGEAERARGESRDDVLGCLRRRRDPREALERAASRFRAVEIDPGALPVTIALAGEIFVRLQPFSNSNVVRLIEEAGGEVVMPPFEEWLHHVSRCIWLAARAHGRGMAQLKLRAAEWYMRRGERRARDVLRRAGSPVPPSQPEIEEIWRASHEAGFIPWFGDASISLGRAIAMRRRGARGVVNLVPYGCLPGTTSEAVFAARRDALRGMPVLHLSLDGGPGPEVRGRVMALVEAAKGYSPPPEPPRPRPRKRYVRPPIYHFWAVD